MDFRQLETFIEVVNLKSFSKAAAKMFLTQPTVTNHIQALEKELGMPLFNRSGKKISTTEAGEMLYNYAIEIINMRDAAQFNINKYQGKIEGILEISSSTIPKQYVLPSLLKSFTKDFPYVGFDISSGDSKNVVQSILDGYTNFGIVGAKYPYKSLNYIDLMDDELVLVTANNPKKYPWDAYSEIDLDDIKGSNLILREIGSGTRLLVEDSLKDAGYSLSDFQTHTTISNNETIKRFIELDMGVSFISKVAVKREAELGVLKPVFVKNLNLKRKFYFVYHSNRYLSPLSETFKNFIIEHIR